MSSVLSFPLAPPAAHRDEPPTRRAKCLRSALDISLQLLSRVDRDDLPWPLLTRSIADLVDADAVRVVVPTAHEPVPVYAALGRVMVVPLAGGQTSYGSVEVRRRADQAPFSSSDIELVHDLAEQVAVALELSDARLLEHRSRLLEDRERIARDLHDQVIQRLFATGLRLQGAATVSRDADERERLAAAIDELDETVRQIRTSIFALNCSDSSARTLRRAVIELTSSVGSAFGLRPQVSFRGPIDVLVDPAVVEDVEAVVREGLTNAGKHAHATRVLVDLTATSRQLQLRIDDDGRGISATQRSSGVANMRYRAERHGGTLTFGRAAVGGTRLCWTVPLA